MIIVKEEVMDCRRSGGSGGGAEFYLQIYKGTSWTFPFRYANIHWGSGSKRDPEFGDNLGNLLLMVRVPIRTVRFGTGVEESDLIERPIWPYDEVGFHMPSLAWSKNSGLENSFYYILYPDPTKKIKETCSQAETSLKIYRSILLLKL